MTLPPSLSQKCSVSTNATFTRPPVNHLTKKDKRGRKKKYQLKKLIEVCSLARLKDPNPEKSAAEPSYDLETGEQSLSVSGFRRTQKKIPIRDQESLSEDNESELEVLGHWDVIGKGRNHSKYEKQIFPPGFRVSKKGVDDSLTFLRKLRGERVQRLKAAKQAYSRLKHSNLSDLLGRIRSKNEEAGSLVVGLKESLG